MTTEFVFETPGDSPAQPATPTGDGNVDLITNHAEEAAALLIEFFRTKPRWGNICTTLIDPIQDFENVVYEWYTDTRDLENATGIHLDRLGALVQEPRSDRTDDEYRRVIAGRILTNKSTGKIPELYAVSDAVTNSQPCELREFYPLAMLFTFYGGVGTARPSDVTRMLRQAKGAGVRLETVIVPTGGLIWGSEDGTPLGGLWGSADGSPVGGLWSSAV